MENNTTWQIYHGFENSVLQTVRKIVSKAYCFAMIMIYALYNTQDDKKGHSFILARQLWR